MKWLFDEEEHADKAEALLSEASQAGIPIIAPPLLPSEVTNSLRQRMRREGMTLSEATRLLTRFLAIPIQLIAPDELYVRALALADAHQLRASYDAQYVALAQLFECELWTDDRKLLRAVTPDHPFVKWIGDYDDDETDQ